MVCRVAPNSLVLKQNIMKIKIGTILYSEYTKRDKTKEISKHTVTKIGKKYFYIDDEHSPRHCNYSIENLKYKSKHSSQYNNQLYFNEQEILDKNEKSEIISFLRNFFSYNYNVKLSLESLCKIKQIITNEPKT